MRNVLAAVTVALAVLFAPSAALGGKLPDGCLPRPDGVKLLRDRFAEAPAADGTAKTLKGQVVGYAELWRSREGRWTVTVTLPNKLMCNVLWGDHWREVIWLDPREGRR